MVFKKYTPKKRSPGGKADYYLRNKVRSGLMQARRSSGVIATSGQVQAAVQIDARRPLVKKRLIFPQERKWFTVASAMDFGCKYTGFNQYGARGTVLNAITQGTTDNQRIGSRIFMTGLRVQYSVRESNAALSNCDNIFDIYLLYYKSGTYSTTMTVNPNSYDTTNPALQPTEIAQFLLPDNNTVGGSSYPQVTTNSLRNPNYLANYKILAHQRCAIPQGSTNTALNSVTGTISWKGALPVNFMDTTASAVSGPGKVALLVVANDNGATRSDIGTGTYLTCVYNSIVYFVDN